MKTTQQPHTVASVLVMCFVLTLAGCAAKPPGCGDAETVKILERMVMDAVEEAQDLHKPVGRHDLSAYFFAAMSLARSYGPADRGKITELHREALQSYKDGISTALVGVTSDGYDDQARKHSCKATLQMAASASNQTMTVKSLEYTVQATVVKDEFLVEAQALQPFIQLVSRDASDFIVGAISKGMDRSPR